ncbi:MAG: DNA repair protein RecO [Spirochaetales bacterium]|nr:DNA repair protein RecO [Spirochaetales bacterium]
MSQNRHIVAHGIVLRTYTFREIDRNFVLISPELGIIRATAYGACKVKSRFCATVQPFVSATFNFYYNPQDQSYKLEDIAEADTHDELRADIRLLYLVSFYCDLIQNTFIAPEDFKSYYYMLVYSLEILSPQGVLNKSFLFFAAKFLFLNGTLNISEGCCVCGKNDETYYYDTSRAGLVCHNCAAVKRYPLSRISSKLFGIFLTGRYTSLRELDIPPECFGQLYGLLLSLIKVMFDKPLKTEENLKYVFG